VLKDKLDDQQSVVSTIAALQKELANEQFARRDAEVCSKVAHELKEMVDQLLVLVSLLETQVGALNGTIMDMFIELRTRSLCLE
jgi:hypothetical protein